MRVFDKKKLEPTIIKKGTRIEAWIAGPGSLGKHEAPHRVPTLKKGSKALT